MYLLEFYGKSYCEIEKYKLRKKNNCHAKFRFME